MHQVGSLSQLRQLLKRIRTAIADWDDLPAIDRRDGFIYHTDAAAVIDKRYHEVLRHLSSLNATVEFFIIALQPGAEDYYYDRFAWIPAFVLGADDTSEDYAAAFSSFPDESPADSIGSRADYIAIFPEGLEWFVAADRNADLAWTYSCIAVNDMLGFPHFMTDEEYSSALSEVEQWRE